MRFAFIAIPFLIKLCTRLNLFSNIILYLLFVHCRVYLLLLTEFSHLQKLTFFFQQHWIQHGVRRAQCGSENTNC